MIKEYGWVLIYICAFGISDYIVKKYITSDYSLLYYLVIGSIGYYILKNRLDY